MYEDKFVNVHKLQNLRSELYIAYREYKDNFEKLKLDQLQDVKYQDRAKNAIFVAKINEYNQRFIDRTQFREEGNKVLIDMDYDFAIKWIRNDMQYCTYEALFVRDLPDFAYETVEDTINRTLAKIVKENNEYIQPMLKIKELLLNMLELVVEGKDGDAKHLIEELGGLVKNIPYGSDSEDLILRTLAEDRMESIYFYQYITKLEEQE